MSGVIDTQGNIIEMDLLSNVTNIVCLFIP